MTTIRTYHSDQLGQVTIPDDWTEDESLDTVEWLATLEMEGFVHGRNWLEKGNARVVFDDTLITIYRFDARRCLEWAARFDLQVPASVIGAAIEAALR